jgi:hypothetical protein
VSGAKTEGIEQEGETLFQGDAFVVPGPSQRAVGYLTPRADEGLTFRTVTEGLFPNKFVFRCFAEIAVNTVGVKKRTGLGNRLHFGEYGRGAIHYRGRRGKKKKKKEEEEEEEEEERRKRKKKEEEERRGRGEF